MASFAEDPLGDPKAGEKIFKIKCALCHTVEKGASHKQGEPLGARRTKVVVLPTLERKGSGRFKHKQDPASQVKEKEGEEKGGNKKLWRNSPKDPFVNN